MAYSTESIQAFWAMMRRARSKPFLVQRLLQRMDGGEIDEREAAEWLASEECRVMIHASGYSRARIRQIGGRRRPASP
jgi:hypothetical protein